MRGANFSHAHMTVVMPNQSMGLLRTECIAAKLAGAHFDGAVLCNAEFYGADLTDADFIGAKITGATFESATFTSVKGLAPSMIKWFSRPAITPHRPS